MEDVKVIEERVYSCPFCGTRHSSEEKARACMGAGKWLEEFDERKVLWRWTILKNSCGNVFAYLPRKIERRYDWAGNPSCIRRCMSVFNSFSNSYTNVTPSDTEFAGEWIIVETLGIMEGYEKYGLVPPVRYMRDIPEEAKKEIEAVLEDAFLRRKKEIRDALGGDPDALSDLLIGFTAPDFVQGRETKPLADMDAFPKTSLIMDEALLDLENHVPAFAKKKDGD